MRGSRCAPLIAAPSAGRRPRLRGAEAAFGALTATERTEVHLLLIVTGDVYATVSDRLGGRLHDATLGLQRAQGLPETGVLTPDTLARLRAVGGPIFRSWDMRFIDHPSAGADPSVPGSFGLAEARTPRCLACENRSQTFSVAFAAYPNGDASMGEVFDNLSRPTPNRRIDMKVLRPDFFAVAGGGDRYGTDSRSIATADGFTATWRTDRFPSGDRVAVPMANGLFPHRPTPGRPGRPRWSGRRRPGAGR